MKIQKKKIKVTMKMKQLIRVNRKGENKRYIENIKAKEKKEKKEKKRNDKA